MSDTQYEFDRVTREAYERLDIMLGVYQYVDGKTVTLLVSDGLCKSKGKTREELTSDFNAKMFAEVHPDDQSRLAKIGSDFAKKLCGYDVVYRTLGADGTYHTIHTTGSYRTMEDGTELAFLVYDDITKSVSEGMSLNSNYYAPQLRLVENSIDGFAVVEPKTHQLLYYNKSIKNTLKPKRTIDSDITFEEFFFDTTEKNKWIDFSEYVDNGTALVDSPNGGTKLAVSVTMASWDKRTAYLLRIENRDLYFFDSLTGLPNINYFREEAAGVIHNMFEAGEVPVIGYTNIVGMKAYNTEFGFEEGDKLLKDVARILTETFPDALVSRSYADRFVTLMSMKNLEAGYQIAFDKVMERALGSIVTPYTGFTVCKDESVAPTQLVDRAKLAYERIKDDARVSHAYDTDLAIVETFRKERYILDNFDKALDEGWIRVYYQPIFRALTGQVRNCEALARWEDPELGVISPADFIPVLESRHLINKLDMHMIDLVCSEFERRVGHGLKPIPISVNLAKDDLERPYIVKEVSDILDAHGVDRSGIVIEITENTFSSDLERYCTRIKEFRDAGFSVWIDDFGSGYSSLNILQSVQANLLKLDMEFVRNYEPNSKNAVLIESIVR